MVFNKFYEIKKMFISVHNTFENYSLEINMPLIPIDFTS